MVEMRMPMRKNRRRNARKIARRCFHVLRAVDEIHVLLGTHPVDGVGLALAQRAAGRGHARGERRAKRVRCVPLLRRNRSFLFNCGLNIV